MLVLISCDKIDSMLDTTNYQKTDTSSFPKTEKDAEQLVNSAYYSLRQFFVGSIFQVNVFRNMIAIFNHPQNERLQDFLSKVL